MTPAKVAIIPARGGSKRIPRKNIKQFFGKPLIAWVIEKALSADCFDKIIVSTDDEEIAEVAKHYGAEVPYLRDVSLAGDHVATRPVINDTIRRLEIMGVQADLLCCIYPTAALMLSNDLIEALKVLEASDHSFVFSCTEYPHPVERSFKIHKQRGIEMLFGEHRLSRTQDIQPTFYDAGQFYWGKKEAFLANESMFSDKSLPWILPSYRTCDIDTEEDWKRAELLFKLNNDFH